MIVNEAQVKGRRGREKRKRKGKEKEVHGINEDRKGIKKKGMLFGSEAGNMTVNEAQVKDKKRRKGKKKKEVDGIKERRKRIRR